MKKDDRIAVLMGGLSSEREVSMKTGEAVLRALLELGYNAFAVDVDRNVPAVLVAEGVDAAFIALHGTYGEDGAIWGGEFLLANYSSYRRLSHLAYVPMPGGDAAVREPWRLALAWLVEAELEWDADLPGDRFGEWRWWVSVIRDGTVATTSSEWMFWFNPFPTTPTLLPTLSPLLSPTPISTPPPPP